MSETPDLAREPAARASGVPVKASRVSRVIGAVWPLAVIGLLFLVDFPICPSRGLLGVPCPGCGLTRATFALLQGDLHGMLHYHPLAPVLSPLFAFALLRTSAVSAGLIESNKLDLFAKVPNWIWGTFLAAMLGLFLARVAGLLGGLPDPIDFSEGLIGKAIAQLSS